MTSKTQQHPTQKVQVYLTHKNSIVFQKKIIRHVDTLFNIIKTKELIGFINELLFSKYIFFDFMQTSSLRILYI